VTASSGKIFANLLRTRDGKTITLHLVNSDFVYPSNDIRDDNGNDSGRTYFAQNNTRAKKVLLAPDLAAAKGYGLKFLGATSGAANDNFTLVVSFNGQDIATLKGSKLNAMAWYEVPIPDGLLKNTNEAVFRAGAEANMHPNWFAIRVDSTVPSQRSWWSADEGKTWTQDDLGPDPGKQTGEYMVRLGPPTDPNAVAKPEDFMGKLQVRPAQGIEVRINTGGKALTGQLVSADGLPERKVKPRLDGKFAVYPVDRVDIYSVLVLPDYDSVTSNTQ
jgi:hypothetical protein